MSTERYAKNAARGPPARKGSSGRFILKGCRRPLALTTEESAHGMQRRRVGLGDLPRSTVFVLRPSVATTKDSLKETATMKVTNGAAQRGDDNQPLTPTEMEACRQFKASQMNGHVLFHPRVASGDPMPDCLVFVEKTCRFGVMFLTGVYSVEDGQWYHRENDGDAPVPLGDYDPLEEAWQRAHDRQGRAQEEAGHRRLLHPGGGVRRHGTR